MNSKLVIKYIINWIKSYCFNNKIKCLVIGVSGGIDSALTSTLCAKTGLKTIVVSMPIHQNKKQLNLAEKHITWLKKNHSNIEVFNIDLSEVFNLFKDTMPKELQNNLGLANSRARLRMTTLYQIAASKNGIIVGTGNKIEDFGIGFFTKYGDGGVDISPIGDLLKSEVYNLARSLKILKEIQKAEPTDGLWEDNRSDYEQIGATYEEIEWAMKNLEKCNLNQKEKDLVKLYKNYNKINKHKMSSIPICLIPKELQKN